MLETRDLELSEVQKALFIEEECFTTPWRAEDFAKMVTDENMVYVALLLDGEIIGGAGLRNIVGDGEITNVAILKKFRGMGYSKTLIEGLLKRGKEIGCSAFTLEVRVSNEAAIACYKNAGFEDCGIRPGFYQHPKEDAMIMWLK